METFKKRLREVRGTENQADFAKKIGIKTAAYGHYETGRSEPSLSVILKIVEITGRSADWLLGLDSTSKDQASKSADATPLQRLFFVPITYYLLTITYYLLPITYYLLTTPKYSIDFQIGHVCPFCFSFDFQIGHVCPFCFSFEYFAAFSAF